MAKKKQDEQTEEQLIEAALAVVAEELPSEKLSETPTGDKQPMSLEDALAAAEQAASELVVDEPAPKKHKLPEDDAADAPTFSAATFNPALIDEDAVVAVAPVEEIPVLEDNAGIASADFAIADAEAELAENTVIEVPVNTMPVLNVTPEEAPAEETPAPAPQVDMGVPAVEPVAEEPVKPAPKKQPAKKPAKPKKEVAPVEEIPAPAEVAPVVQEAPVEAVPEEKEAAPKKGKKSSSKKDKTEAKEEVKAAEEPAEKIEAKTAKNKKIKKKLEPDKNFKLLKSLIFILGVLLTALSGHYYYTYIYVHGSQFEWTKLIPIVPYFAQILLVFVSFITIGTSKRKPIGATIKANAQEAKEIKEKKEFDDNLLVPEIDLTTRRTTELSSYQIDNFYKKNIEEINGKYYMQIAKFDESARAFEAMGATDMELCAVNMVGNAKFDEILNQPRAKTLNTSELISYFLSKPNTFCIKKRGAIDWTFKYDSKSFGIIRESDDSYKVSIKCYPDAATKINDTYKALEDSNFPSGPLWYCFNELRNLPPRVCKWLVDTSCQISKFQQIKTDKLKEEKPNKDCEADIAVLAEKFKAGEKVINMGKYSVVFTKAEDADLTTFLTREIEGLDAAAYTKEYYYKFATSDDAVSILCPTKGVNEDIVIGLLDNIERVLK